MSETVEQLKSQVNTLSPSERVELANYLIDSIESPEADVEQAWQIELIRRKEEIVNGTAKGRPVDEVLDELRELYP